MNDKRGIATSGNTALLHKAKIENWRGGVRSACSLTFDDALPVQIEKLIPMLDARDLKGSFYLITSKVNEYTEERGIANWNEWKAVSEKGHEIGSHSHSHVYCTKLSNQRLRSEFETSNQLIKKNVEVNNVYTFVYPMADRNRRTDKVASEYYLSTRAGKNGNGKSQGQLSVSPDCSAYQSLQSFVWKSDSLISEGNDFVENAIRMKGWSIVMIHGVDGQGWEPPTSETLVSHFDYIAEKRNAGQLWVDTYANVAKYSIERNHSVLIVEQLTEREFTVCLKTAVLPPEPVELTISFKIPQGWGDNIKVTQSDMELDLRILENTGYFNIMPDPSKEVTVSICAIQSNSELRNPLLDRVAAFAE